MNSVTLRDIVLSVRYGDAALVGESAGYLVLAATDLGIEAPRQFGLDGVLVIDDGRVEVDASTCTHAESEAQLRLLLGQLLLLVRTACPNLQRVADRKETRGLKGLQRELEAALVPVNRKAARRSLARLVREAMKSALRGSAAMRTMRVDGAAERLPSSSSGEFAAPTIECPEGEIARTAQARALPPVNEAESVSGESAAGGGGSAPLPAGDGRASSVVVPALSVRDGEGQGAARVGPGGRAAGHSPKPIQNSAVGRSRWTITAQPLPSEVVSQLSASTQVSQWDTAEQESQAPPTVHASEESGGEGLCEESRTPRQEFEQSVAAPPELVIDTTPTEVYAKVTEEQAPIASIAEDALAFEMAKTPQLAEVSARVAQRAEETWGPGQPSASWPDRLAVSERPPASAQKCALPPHVSLIPPSEGGAPERRPSGIDDLLNELSFQEEPREELYSGLQQLSRVDWSPLAPPVGCTWMKD